jgi:DNA invertase Pin-like site-specific DNA recombinase
MSAARGIDATTDILVAIADFERDRSRERIVAGLQRAKAQGKRIGPKSCAGDRRSWKHRAGGSTCGVEGNGRAA